MPADRVRGVGPQLAHRLASLGLVTVRDILLHMPRRYEDRKTPVTIADAIASGQDPAIVNTVATVVAHATVGRTRVLKIVVEDETGHAALVCFGRDFLSRNLPVGARVAVYGTFSYRYGEFQTTSFDTRPISGEGAGPPPEIRPIYPLGTGIAEGTMRRTVHAALSAYGRELTDDLPASIRDARPLPPTAVALRMVHRPESFEEANLGMRSLAFSELFLLQVYVARRAEARRRSTREPTPLPQSKMRRLLDALPFRLTDDQSRVLHEIVADISGPTPCARLLQGDVGSGKTLPALLAAAAVIEAGGQVAFMAPTELLARQHAATAARLLDKVDVRTALLAGDMSAQARRLLLTSLEAGEIDLVVGTHSVFTDSVTFHRLRFVIIDEQHRFGVLQRAALIAKGQTPDVLLMTATPIPRTLALTVYGDLDTSTIRELPPGRTPVRTHLARMENRGKAFDFVRNLLEQGRQAYFVFPRIDATTEGGPAALNDFVEEVRVALAPFRVELVHGRMPQSDRIATMDAFIAGDIRVLAATTVIEVGIDVPNAAAVVIFHADRFGVAALHQLRGRVGRGGARGYCFLLYDDDLTETARERLKILKLHNDGFEVAERDLALRGPGNLTGREQSGYVRLRVADLGRDADLLTDARSAAFQLIEGDPGLLAPENVYLADYVRHAIVADDGEGGAPG